MIINQVEVQSSEHLEELILHMDEESKQGLRQLYEQEIADKSA